MEKSKILELLEGQDQQHSIEFANYICKLHAELDGNNKPVNYYLHSRSEEDMAEAYKKVKKEGLVFDGKNIKMTSNGVSFNYVAFKNKMLSIYPESKIDIELVFDGDEFSYEKIDGKITYKLKVKNPFEDKKDEKVIGGFCIIKNQRGEFITRITTEEMKKHRALAIDSFYWKNWFQEMCKKTVIKKACKEHFEDKFEGVNEMDNENYDVSNPVNLDVKWKTEIDAINTTKELAIYWKNNQGHGADFTDYMTKRKNQIKEDREKEKEIENKRIAEIKKKIGGIKSQTVLKTVYDQVKNEYKGTIPKEIVDCFNKKEKTIKPDKIVGIDLAKKGKKSKTAKVKTKKQSKDEQIKQLEENINYEENQYEVCLEHPTDTNQFRKGMRKHRERIERMKENLKVLRG